MSETTKPNETTAVFKVPEIRVRIAHAHTLKEGWRLSETTVELTSSLETFAGLEDEVARALTIVHMLGTIEAERRIAVENSARLLDLARTEAAAAAGKASK